MAAIPFVREFEFEYGRCDRLSGRIRRVIADNPGPFTYTGTGVYIVGHGEVAVIDPGPLDSAHAEALDAALAGERVTHVLVTHHHLDHSPLARPLAAKHGAKIYGRALRGPAAPDGPVTEAGDDTRFCPDIEIEDGAKLAGPDWTIKALHTPGHTSNHVCYALLEENALFSGDHIMGWSTSVVSPPDGHMGHYLASLERVAQRGFETIWPTHGPPVRDPAPFVQAYIDHRLARERQILDQLAAGRQAIPDIVEILYADVDRRLHPAAAHSVLAHMIRLVETGQAVCDGEPALAARYSLPPPQG